VSTHATEVVAEQSQTAPEVHVTWDPHGGWQVDALVDGRIVATRHCDDWHRVERVRRTLAEPRPPGRPLARATALSGRR
jgi:hypothetical protein